MPAVVPFAIAFATAGTAYATVGALAAFAASALIGAYQQKQAKKKARDEFNAAQVDRLVNAVTTISQRELVLGRVRKGGPVIFQGSAGQYKQRFFRHIALAAHEIDAVEEVWLNDQRVTIDPATGRVVDAPYARYRNVTAGVYIPAGSTGVVLPQDPVVGSISVATSEVSDDTVTYGSVAFSVTGRTVSITPIASDALVSYQYVQAEGFAQIYWTLGSPGAGADGETKAWFPGVWTDAHRNEGIATLVAIFDYDDSAFPSGIPNITVVMRGAKVYDPRSGLTVWSENPALLARHVYQHDKFGKATVSAAEDTRFIAAANACDAVQSWNVNGVVTSAATYRAGTVVPFGAQPAAVLDDLTQAMAGMWAFAGGEFYIRAGAYTSPVATFGDNDVATIQRSGDSVQQDKISISPHRERAEKFNVVNARIWDSSQGYKEVALTPLKATALITADGEELAQEVAMPAVPYSYQALHISGVMMRDARDPMTIEVPLKANAYPVEIFDVVAFSFARYGWDSSPKAFIVLSRVWDRDKGLIKLTGKETAAAIFQADASFSAQGFADNTALPNPWEIDPPGTLVITSGTSDLLIGTDGTIVTRVRVSWPEIADPRITSEGKVEVQWSDATATSWNSIIVDGSVPAVYITGVADGMVIVVRARTRTSLASSDWGLQQQHTVLGKSLPPGVPTGVSLTQELVFFRPPTDLDLAGVRIRAVPGVQSAPIFSRGTDVITGLIRTSPARIEGHLYGVQTIMVVAEDTSGNQSAPAFASLDFGQPDIASAVWDRVFAEESFPGTYTDCTLSGGTVVADVAASSDVYMLADLYGEPDVYATQYDAMVWQAAMVVPPYAGALVLTSTIAGNAPAVEYRISGDTTTDLYASSDVYAAADLYGAPDEWAAWPGTLDVPRSLPLDFRVSVGASTERGTVSEFTLSLVMEPSAQLFSNVTLDAAGTRLSPASGTPSRHWIVPPLFVYFMPAAGGAGAIAGRVLDFSPSLGPLAQFVDNTGTGVTASGSVKVEGFSDE